MVTYLGYELMIYPESSIWVIEESRAKETYSFYDCKDPKNVEFS